jgi:hypothetical protein
MVVTENSSSPFDYVVIDNFVSEKEGEQLVNDFPSYNSDVWNTSGYVYNSPLERKKTLRDWKIFPPSTYQLFSKLCSPFIIEKIKTCFNTQVNIYPDYGLHGAGWHSHTKNDHLNIHLDYSIHPFINLQRKYNLILYLTPDWKKEWGGGLEFWSHDNNTNLPKEKIKVIENVYKRAVIFDTTQNSWHGISEQLNCPDGVCRNSIAMYYLTDIVEGIDSRKKALYAPSKTQENNEEIKTLIKKRAGVN